MSNNTCPLCGEGTIKESLNTKTYEYKGRRTHVKNVLIRKCDTCNESFEMLDDNEHVYKELTQFRRRVDKLLTPSEIQEIRKHFNMTQEELARKLGVAQKTFARYESGAVIQGKAMDHLLRILKEMPEAMDVIEGKRKVSICASFRIIDVLKDKTLALVGYHHQPPANIRPQKRRLSVSL